MTCASFHGEKIREKCRIGKRSSAAIAQKGVLRSPGVPLLRYLLGQRVDLRAVSREIRLDNGAILTREQIVEFDLRLGARGAHNDDIAVLENEGKNIGGGQIGGIDMAGAKVGQRLRRVEMPAEYPQDLVR